MASFLFFGPVVCSTHPLRGLANGLLEFIKEYVCPKYALEAMVRGEGAPWTAEV